MFNNKKISFVFDHLETTDSIIVEQDLHLKTGKIKNFKDYNSFLKINKIILDHKEREKIILKKLVPYLNLKIIKNLLILTY